MVSMSGNRSGRSIASIEKEYLLNGNWKCEKSPTGGHRWDCNVEPWICKICGQTKTQPPAP